MIRFLTVVLVICHAAPSLGDAEKVSCVGTWRNQKNSIQFDDDHKVLWSAHSGGLVGFVEMLGTWEELERGIKLKLTQVRLEGLGARTVDESDNLSIEAILHVAADGSRSLSIDNETYQYVSAEAVIPGPWTVTPPREPTDMEMELARRMLPIFGPYPLPRLDLECKTNAAHQIEMVFTKGWMITGGSELAVWEDGATNYLWRIETSGGMPLDRLVYGILPTNSPSYSVSQVQPQLPNVPLLPSQGKLFFVRVDFGYDTLFPPSCASHSMVFVFEYGKDGQIRRVRDVKPNAVKEPIAAKER